MSIQDYSEFKARRERSVWDSLNRLVSILILLVALFMAAVLFLPQLHGLREMKAQRERLRDEHERLKQQVAQHQREVDLLKNDPAYVETIIRDRLEMMKAGETILRMDSPSPAPFATPKPAGSP